MLAKIEDYITAIFKEAKFSITNDFDISDQKGFTAFDYINFHIINKHILEEKSDDLFIGIPEDDYGASFFESIFYSVALIKLYQNFCAYKLNQPELNFDDIIYTNGQIYTYKGSTVNTIRIQLKFPKPNQKESYFEIPQGIYTKLSKEFDYRKSKTIELIQGFSRFLKEKFKDKNFPFLTSFPHKTLVIADQKYFKVDENLPTRYWTKTGKQKYQIPIDTLMEICNDFNTAESYLLNQGDVFDELIVIADSKYNDNLFPQIQNAKWNGKIKNIILIGSKKPITNHIFKEWLWSIKEIKIANNETPIAIKKIAIPSDQLLSHVTEFKTEIDNLIAQYGIDISYLLRYINFYFRLLIVNSENAKAIINEYRDRITAHFSSDEFSNKFYEKDIYDNQLIRPISDILINKFKFFEDFFLAENPKWDKIIELSKKNDKIYLIIDKIKYDYIKKQIQIARLNNIILISDRRIDDKILFLEKWINTVEKNTAEKNYLIPYLNNQEVFNRLQHLKGNCFVLCYKDLDEISFDKIVLNDNTEDFIRLNHADRKMFVSSSFEYIEPIITRGLESIFEVSLSSDKVKLNLEEQSDAPLDDIFYEITFDDNSADVFKSSKAIFLVDGNEQLKTTIGEVYANASIRFYKNDSPETFENTLSIFDINNQMETINKYSNSWFIALKMLKEIYPNNDLLFKNLFRNRRNIHFSTFLNYLDDKGRVRFPRKNTMEAIRDLCIASNLTKIDFVINYDLVLKFSKEDKRIRQQAGKILGADLIDYVASGLSQKSESLSKMPDEVLDKVVKSIIEKKIKYKKLLNNADERIFEQSTIDFS